MNRLSIIAVTRASILILTVIFLTSCRGEVPQITVETGVPALKTATQSGAPEPKATDPVTAATPIPAPTEISLPDLAAPLVWYVRGDAPAGLAEVNAALNKWLAKQGFHAQVTIRPMPGRYLDGVTASEQSESGTVDWDLVSLPNGMYTEWVDRGLLLPLSAYPNATTGQYENLLMLDPALQASLPVTAWESVRSEEQIYGVPNQGAWVRPRGVSIRADVVNALDLQSDLERIHTYDDLTPLFEKLQAALKDGTLKANGVEDASQIRQLVGQVDLLSPENAGYDALAMPFAVRYNDPQLRVINWYETPEFQALAELRLAWQQAGYTPAEPLTPDQMIEGYRAGRYLIEVGHQVWPGSAIEQFARLGYQWVDVLIAPPFLASGDVLSSVTGINAQTAVDPERVRRAVLFLGYLHTDPELYNLLAYGIEGQHWQWSDHAKKVITLAQNSNYRPDFAGQLGDQTLSYALSAQSAGVWEAVRRANAAAPPSFARGFVFDTRPVAAEAAALRGLTPEWLDPLANGQVENIPRQIQRMLKTLNDAGLKAVGDELSGQLSGWGEGLK